MSAIAILLGLIDGASPADLEVLLPPAERRDISCAFAIDYGTPGHLRRVLRDRARRAAMVGQADKLRQRWLDRLAASANKAIRAGGRPVDVRGRKS